MQLKKGTKLIHKDSKKIRVVTDVKDNLVLLDKDETYIHKDVIERQYDLLFRPFHFSFGENDGYEYQLTPLSALEWYMDCGNG